MCLVSVHSNWTAPSRPQSFLTLLEAVAAELEGVAVLVDDADLVLGDAVRVLHSAALKHKSADIGKDGRRQWATYRWWKGVATGEADIGAHG